MGRQRNNPHKKEKQASPEKEVNELEASNLSEKEFREMVIRWLKRMEDKFDNMSKNQEEMKKNQEEMKNDIAAVKNSIESIKSRREEAEDRISELEDKMEKNTQVEQLLEKKMKKQEESLRKLWDNTKQNNIRIIGVPEGNETGEGIENLFEEIMTENFLDIGKKKHTNPRSSQSPKKNEPKRPTPWHIIIKLANSNDKLCEDEDHFQQTVDIPENVDITLKRTYSCEAPQGLQSHQFRTQSPWKEREEALVENSGEIERNWPLFPPSAVMYRHDQGVTLGFLYKMRTVYIQFSISIFIQEN
ncbi:hypothetical protein QTO34_019290 [Cnephaeus nilssonii]|uniref:L1 transposable element RRM domain-containing protein n=1 Tax=Cnephaeus nilssonii TaxID=3371016 RepID=A0AA40HW93_CNENI|nr:hypothetical protein QTO34_019290 [Eptesicus nilssonii]